MVSIEKYPFIFMNTPASLQVLASAEMALTFWRLELANTSASDALKILRSKKGPSCKKVIDVPVPRRIQAQIDKKIVSVGKELEEWMDFHLNRDLYKNSNEEFFNCFNHIVIDFSGSIGYKETAINILNSGEFNDAVNYKISCTFCLEDQVKLFWPAVSNDPPIDVNSPYDKCNLSYWNGLMKVGNSITDTKLVKLRMIAAEAKTNTVPLKIDGGDGTTFEYFCKMLPDDERILKIISWLKCSDYHQAVTLTRTLSTLDRVHAEEVFEEEPSSIFRILMLNDYYFQFAHQLWTLMGHLVLEDESFSDIVSNLWKRIFDPVRYDLCGSNFSRCDQINDLLLEIWSNVSDESKADVSDTFWRCEVINFFGYTDQRARNTTFRRINFARYYGHDMRFVLELFSKWSSMDRLKLWEDNWRGLALRSKPLYLEKFMRMCLAEDYEIELFKYKLADFEDLFESLVEEGFYSDLKDYLLFCSEDTVQFQQLGKKVLGSNVNFILVHDDDKFAKFEWFVGEVFANVQKDMDEFKSQIISSTECLTKNFPAARQADEISSKEYSRRISRFVNNEEELQLVKRKLFEHCREYPTETCFNADEWQGFLEWCTADHEEISAFKRSLDVHLILQKRLKDYLDGKCYVGGLDYLDNFLKWYFGNEKDAKNFKLDKVINYKQIDVLRVEMEKKFIRTNGSMHRLLKWLFDGNVENVLEFCKSCNRSIRGGY